MERQMACARRLRWPAALACALALLAGTPQAASGATRVLRGAHELRGGVLGSDAEQLVNRGSLLLSGRGNEVTSPLENHGSVEVRLGTARFRRPVVNRGSFKLTDSEARFDALYLGLGAYRSDPSDTFFTDLVIGTSGYLVGGEGDRFFVSGDFISASTASTSWNTSDAYLEFRTGVDAAHAFHITGSDQGAVLAGFADNFAWGTLHLAAGNSVELFDGNATAGGALYVEEVTGLLLSGGSVSNVSGAEGVNVYYLPELAANAYLDGQTYAFAGSGQLIPIGAEPEPPAVPAGPPWSAAVLGLFLAAAGVAALRGGRRGGDAARA